MGLLLLSGLSSYFNLHILLKYLYSFVASGRCLNFSSTMVLVLMLRYSLTRIRNLGLSTILPLDHHVYLHKLTGVVILVLAWIHTLSHLINFGVNVQPDPVKFVQLNSDYWVIQPYWVTNASLPNWANIGYNTPPNCQIVERCEDNRSGH